MEDTDYNNEPVYYCDCCLSLRIKTECGIDYCDKCGSTKVVSSSVSIWRQRYKRKYGREFLPCKNKLGD